MMRRDVIFFINSESIIMRLNCIKKLLKYKKKDRRELLSFYITLSISSMVVCPLIALRIPSSFMVMRSPLRASLITSSVFAPARIRSLRRSFKLIIS